MDDLTRRMMTMRVTKRTVRKSRVMTMSDEKHSDKKEGVDK